ncbi:hypothetical protein AMTRI_Chr09g39330 [Amborella trichopoda]
MEFVEFGSNRSNQSVLGRKLAEMHKAGKSDKVLDFHMSQINTWFTDWISFFSEHRLGYQLKFARDQYGDASIYEKGQRLPKCMPLLFEGNDIEPCLLHGDLWNGNIIMGNL